MTATRRQAREWAIQMLTAADLNPPDDISAFLAAFWEELGTLDESQGRAVVSGGLKDFAEERVTGVLTTKDDIDAILVPLLENWDLYRLGTIERCVLRMGVWEMKNSDVPQPVVINEAIDLAKRLSSPKSRSLVHGILDKLAKSL